MIKFNVKIKSIGKLTHDVLKIVTEKPAEYKFKPGQATEIAIDQIGWRRAKRPFTFTCLPDHDYLEFTIKTYPGRKGVTAKLLSLKKNDGLILHKAFGAISYQGEGVFIAGGAGITPFISIIRHLFAKDKIGNNVLVFANKNKSDIIHEQEFKKVLGKNFVNILSGKKKAGYAHGKITPSFLRTYIDGKQKIYVCGPPPMMVAIENQLAKLQVNEASVIKESI